MDKESAAAFLRVPNWGGWYRMRSLPQTLVVAHDDKQFVAFCGTRSVINNSVAWVRKRTIPAEASLLCPKRFVQCYPQGHNSTQGSMVGLICRQVANPWLPNSTLTSYLVQQRKEMLQSTKRRNGRQQQLNVPLSLHNIDWGCLRTVTPGNLRQKPIYWKCSACKTRFSSPVAIFRGPHRFAICIGLSKFRTSTIT
jgi:hypothetical protein